MPTQGFWAFGTTIQYGDGNTPEAFTAIAELLDITGPSSTRDWIDMTNHQSTDGYEDGLGGIKRSPMMTLPCNWIPDDASHDGLTGMASLFDSGRRANFQVLLPDSGTSMITFTGLAMKTGPTNLPVNGGAKAGFDIKPVGKITWP